VISGGRERGERGMGRERPKLTTQRDVLWGALCERMDESKSSNHARLVIFSLGVIDHSPSLLELPLVHVAGFVFRSSLVQLPTRTDGPLLARIGGVSWIVAGSPHALPLKRRSLGECMYGSGRQQQVRTPGWTMTLCPYCGRARDRLSCDRRRAAKARQYDRQ